VSGFSIHYANGDITQPHSQVFMTRKWTDDGDPFDNVEITKLAWFTVDELQALNLHQNMKNIIDAYLAFINTGKYQVLEKQIDR
jgi:hypothetical protein